MTDVITQHLDVWTSALASKATAGRGSSDKQAAYGIKKLRELILATALRGLFETKNEYLDDTIDEQIKNSRKTYYQSISKKPKEYAFGPALLHEFTLPNGWQWKRVGELCDLQTGATPSTQRSEYFSGNIPWLVSGDINQGVINDCGGRISEEAMNNSNCKILPKKTVLIALNGQGKTRASVALLNIPATCNQSLVGMISFDHSILEPTFLLLALKYRYYEIRDITGQNQRRGLNMGLVAELSIPLPPIATQHRIVAKVDELMALCDQLEQQQTDSIAAHQTLVQTLLDTLTQAADAAEFEQAWSLIVDHFDTLFTTESSIDQLKQTLLQLAVMGKLVPQDPNDVPAKVLLQTIIDEKQQLAKEGKIRIQNKLTNISKNEKPFEIPDSWRWSHVFDLAQLITSGSRDWAKYYSENGAIFVTMGNLSRGSYELRMDSIRYVTPPQDGEGSRTKLEENDLLISITGDVGNLGLIPNNFGEAYINQHTCLLRFMPQIQNRYFPEFMRSPWAKLQFDSPQRGVKNSFRLSDVGEMIIPVPPLSEQYRIVAKIDELMALCDALKARIAAAQNAQLQLADAIVEQAVA